MRKLDVIIRVHMLLCESSMLLFVSVCCYSKPRCYYLCPYAVMRKLDAIIRVCMLLCQTSMLLFVFRIVFVLIRVACVASVPIRAELKYRAARRSFRVREARKMGREHPSPSSFLLSPHFPRFPNTKTPSRGPMLKFGSYGSACYAGNNPGLQRARPLWSGASDKLIMPILPAERKFMLLSQFNGRGCEEIVFEHLI